MEASLEKVRWVVRSQRRGIPTIGVFAVAPISVIEYVARSVSGSVNPLMGTLKPQSNGPLYSNTVIGTLAVDECAVTFGTARRGLGGLRPRPVPSSLYQT